MKGTLASYFSTLDALCRTTEVTNADGRAIALDEGIRWFQRMGRETHACGNTLMFIGNGGSAGIASHTAIDYMKNGGMRARVFTDGAALTCLGNDLGYENVYATQIEYHARPGDLLIAISSSGNSMNIRNAVTAARAKDCVVATFSGFKPDNALRAMGDMNFYVPSMEYGFVELGHQILLHAALDLAMGWHAPAGAAKTLESLGEIVR
ncbi:SIS domain-containing protein [Azospirillum sp. RWY-5-1]|uniref:SIS domain-containing protein n=1 Tax=Azospirillum oleiclasticum TaxID=2735135 RepID=A0ABX2TN86_9PROT|nr:SIS domain-containing protein [Azospirillum oleiclasticum]NYZ17843.1 SIS domain-containing protein [Azospirillum oleiclasticum]NYZ25025.1 SIS domain-containing protein [Azospirillum oleiclasticum]